MYVDYMHPMKTSIHVYCGLNANLKWIKPNRVQILFFFALFYIPCQENPLSIIDENNIESTHLKKVKKEI